MELILDPGSTHMGKKDYAIEIVETAAHCGASAVKFQLFKPGSPQDTGGNIPLPYEWMKELVKRGEAVGVEVFASVFDSEAIYELGEAGATSIKLAYSMTKEVGLLHVARTHFKRVYQSYGIMNVPNEKHFNDIWLYCIPEYPVLYTIDPTPLEYLFFDGFSDHTQGIWQTEKLIGLTDFIEKHFKLEKPDINCPDSRFAIGTKEMKTLSELIGCHNLDKYWKHENNFADPNH